MSSDLVLLVVGAVIAGFVQGLSGFAFSIIAMSVWVWGVDPRLASVMAVFGSLTGQLVSAVSVRRKLHLKSLAPYLAGGLAGIPLGIVLLPLLNPDAFKLGLGVILVVWCPLMLLSPGLPRLKRGGRVADGLAGVAGGFMGGIGGLTGVIPTLWCTLRGMEKDQQRALIQSFNLTILAVTMVAYVATGVVTRDMVPLLPVVACALLIPSLLGARVFAGLSEESFRRVVLALLGLSGVAMLLASLARLVS